MLEKARGIAVDEVVIDLEDAVVAERKAEARAAAVAALAAGDFAARAVSVRINAPGTAWAHDDLIALGGAPRRPASVVVPKVESVEDVSFVERTLGEAERLPVQALVETARGLRAIDEIATASSTTQALVLGYAGPGGVAGPLAGGGREPRPLARCPGCVPDGGRAPRAAARSTGRSSAIDDEDGLRAPRSGRRIWGSTASGDPSVPDRDGATRSHRRPTRSLTPRRCSPALEPGRERAEGAVP